MYAALISRDDVIEFVGAAAFVVGIFGLAASLLWLRDKSRDARGVPEWKRRRAEMRAARIVAAYWTLGLCASLVGAVLSTARGKHYLESALFLFLVVFTLWKLRFSWRAYQTMGKAISEITAQNEAGVKRPYEPLG